jgi:hypothetical protein
MKLPAWIPFGSPQPNSRLQSQAQWVIAEHSSSTPEESVALQPATHVPFLHD